MKRYLKQELIRQVTRWTGREPYAYELAYAWFQMFNMSREELLGALVEINELLYTRQRFLSR